METKTSSRGSKGRRSTRPPKPAGGNGCIISACSYSLCYSGHFAGVGLSVLLLLHVQNVCPLSFLIRSVLNVTCAIGGCVWSARASPGVCIRCSLGTSAGACGSFARPTVLVGMGCMCCLSSCSFSLCFFCFWFLCSSCCAFSFRSCFDSCVCSCCFPFCSVFVCFLSCFVSYSAFCLFYFRFSVSCLFGFGRFSVFGLVSGWLCAPGVCFVPRA